jgi:hypothetical protein
MKIQPRFGSSSARLGIEALEDRCVPATLLVGDATVTELTAGARYAVVHVTLSEPLKKPVMVNYGTSNGTAVAGSDYTAVSGSLTFAKGETVKTISVSVIGDQLPEPNETFTVRLSNPKGAEIADGLGIVTIVDSPPRLSVSAPAEDEGGVMTVTVSLSAPLSTAFTVNFSTVDGTAIAGEDYVATSGTLTFAPGETTKTFTVQILADGLAEDDEGFWIRLSQPSAPVSMWQDSLVMIWGNND